jgi:predicted nuclease with TOPRIM domain
LLKENEEKIKDKLKYYVKKNRGLEEQLNSVQLENSDLQDEIARLR